MDFFCWAYQKNCIASATEVSSTKLVFIKNNKTNVDISLIYSFLHFHVIEMTEGLKYLGNFLKPNWYRVKDWFQLVKKVEKILVIGHIDSFTLGGGLHLLRQYWLGSLFIGFPWIMFLNLFYRKSGRWFLISFGLVF